MSFLPLRACVLAFALGVLAGCSDEPRAATVLPETRSALCDNAPATTLDAVYAGHFASTNLTGCTAGCHESGTGGLTFRDASSLWSATVNHASSTHPERLLVEPGWPERSELYLRLLPDAAVRMPQGGPYLDDAALRDVAGWICAGAPQPSSADGGTPTPDGGTGNPQPALDSVTPPSVLVGAGEVAVALNGTSFLSSSQVLFDGTAIAATYASANRLDVRLPAAVSAEAGTHRFQVTNPAPGGGTSAEQSFSVLNPVPTLSGLNPSSVATQGAPFTLTLTGTNFAATSVVNFDGADVTTTFVSATTLTARIPTLTSARGYPVLVHTPAPGGGTSNSVTLNAVVSNLPTVTGLSPSRVASDAAFSLTVTGSGYTCTPTKPSVLFNGGGTQVSACSATQLTVNLPATPAGDYPVQVKNANGDTSNTMTLSVVPANPVPTLSALSPSQAARGGTAFTLQVTGTNFVQGATVSFNGSARSTTFVSATQVTAAIPASDLTTAGSFPVVVTNPAPGGGASNSLPLAVVAPNPVPTVSSLSPCGMVANGSAFTLTVNGTGFVSGASVTFNGSAVTANVVSASQLQLSIPGSLVASAPANNAAAVIVTNPAPGGGASTPAYFGVATSTSTLAGNVQAIFDKHCNSGCHGTAGTPVNLTSTKAYTELVGAPSSGCPSELRVLACGPLRSQSVLIDKILATSTSMPCSGSPMPKTGSLTAADKQAIVDWVAQGAPQQ